MSRLYTKQALLDRLLTNLPTGVTVDDIKFKNPWKAFETEGRDIWLKTHIVEASSDTTGKSRGDSDEQRGFFQIDVFIPRLGTDYDNKLYVATDEIATAFSFGTQLVYNGQVVNILDSTSPDSKEDGAWFRKMITINYLTISARI